MSAQPQMTTQEALNTIDQALASVNANRQTHIALQQCIQTIVEELNRFEKEKDRLELLLEKSRGESQPTVDSLP